MMWLIFWKLLHTPIQRLIMELLSCNAACHMVKENIAIELLFFHNRICPASYVL